MISAFKVLTASLSLSLFSFFHSLSLPPSIAFLFTNKKKTRSVAKVQSEATNTGNGQHCHRQCAGRRTVSSSSGCSSSGFGSRRTQRAVCTSKARRSQERRPWRGMSLKQPHRYLRSTSHCCSMRESCRAPHCAMRPPTPVPDHC